MSRPLRACAALTAALATVLIAAAPAAHGAWAPEDPLFVARYSAGVAVSPGGDVYVVGGSIAADDLRQTRQGEVFDGTTWAPIRPMPTARAQVAAAFGGDGRLYAIGGYDSRFTILTRVDAYDPATDTWSAAAPLPEPRAGLAAVTGPDGRIYAIGGSPPGTHVAAARVWALDTTAGTWSRVADLPERRADMAAALGPDGAIYVFGGLDDGPRAFTSQRTSTVFRYDPVGDSWTVRSARLDAPTAWNTAATVGDNIYVLGGYAPRNVRSSVRLYSPAADAFSTVTPLPLARSGLSAAARGDSLVVVGGHDARNTVLASVVSLPLTLPDVTAPEITTAPVPSLTRGTQLGADRVPVLLRWAALDDESLVGSYALEGRTAPDPYAPIALDDPDDRSAGVLLAPGAAPHRFRVAATNAATLTSAPSQGPEFELLARQETSSRIRYTGRWSGGPSRGAYGGRTRSTTQDGARAGLRFTGRSIAWVAPRSAKRGRARVYVDGRLAAIVDLRAATPTPRTVVFARTWAQTAVHTIIVKATGTPGRPRVDVDAFVVIR